MTRALRIQLASERRAAREADEVASRSPLFNLTYNKVSVGFSLLRFAEMLCQLNKPGADDARNVAERVYVQAMQYAEQLPDDERPSALFHVGRLRRALDDLKIS